MGSKKRTKQGGSVVSYMIIGLILTAGLIGGVYYLKQHGDQVRREQAIAAANQQQSSQSTDKSSGTGTSGGTTTGSDGGSTSTGTSTSTGGMPTTGPESIIFESISVYVLTVAAVSYATSRRDLKRYL